MNEAMIGTLLKTFGIDTNVVKEQAAGFGNLVKAFGEKLAYIETQNNRIEKKLDMLLELTGIPEHDIPDASDTFPRTVLLTPEHNNVRTS